VACRSLHRHEIRVRVAVLPGVFLGNATLKKHWGNAINCRIGSSVTLNGPRSRSVSPPTCLQQATQSRGNWHPRRRPARALFKYFTWHHNSASNHRPWCGQGTTLGGEAAQ
jgi:hypothetical protein